MPVKSIPYKSRGLFFMSPEKMIRTGDELTLPLIRVVRQEAGYILRQAVGVSVP